MKFCASCGAVITRMRVDARFCSDTCRQRGHRAKRASDGLEQLARPARSAAPPRPCSVAVRKCQYTNARARAIIDLRR